MISRRRDRIMCMGVNTHDFVSVSKRFMLYFYMISNWDYFHPVKLWVIHECVRVKSEICYDMHSHRLKLRHRKCCVVGTPTQLSSSGEICERSAANHCTKARMVKRQTQTPLVASQFWRYLPWTAPWALRTGGWSPMSERMYQSHRKTASIQSGWATSSA